MHRTNGQSVAVFSCALLLAASLSGAQEGALKITILEGDEAILNTRERVAREAIVKVEDENNKPVAGAFVTFVSPNNGASAVFSNGLKSITIETGADGRAVLRGITPNQSAGKYEVRIRAVKEGKSGQAVLAQTNVVKAVAVAGGMSAKALGILLAVGAAGAVGAAVALGGGGSSPANPGGGGTPALTSVTLTPGSPTVGGPR